MINLNFKRDSKPIDDEDLRAVTNAVIPLFSAGTGLQPDYLLLIAKLILRIGEQRSDPKNTKPATQSSQHKTGYEDTRILKLAGQHLSIVFDDAEILDFAHELLRDAEALRKRGEFYDFLEETSAPEPDQEPPAPLCTVCGAEFGGCGNIRLVPTGFQIYDPAGKCDIPEMDSCERSDCPAIRREPK